MFPMVVQQIEMCFSTVQPASEQPRRALIA